MSKRVAIKSKPAPQPAETTADDWVNNRGAEPKAMKRLTFDISESLHRRIKVSCAKRGVKMSDELRELLERHYSK